MNLTLLVYCLFLAAVSWAFYAGFKYTRMISNIFLSLVYNPSLETPVSSRGERVTILDSADKEIDALFVERKRASKLVLFCHESGATKESWEKYAYFLPAQGFHLLSLDIHDKASEASSNALSQWPTEQDMQKLLTVVRWAKRVLGPDLSIVLFGVSNGADLALAASFHDPAVKGVIADGLFSMKEVFRDYIRKWAPILVRPNLFGEKYPRWVLSLFSELGFWYSQKKSGLKFIDVEKLLKKKHVPVLMIHGECDDYIPPTHQKFLEKICRKNGLERLVVPKAGHNEAIALGRQSYEKKISEFMVSLK